MMSKQHHILRNELQLQDFVVFSSSFLSLSLFLGVSAKILETLCNEAPWRYRVFVFVV
jgi:hypothetical protein